MLLSPGHSPRHISSPSPPPSPSVDPDALQTPGNSKSLLASRSPNPSNPRRNDKKGEAVLDEDSYVAAIEKIIERDFFPDIPKLRDRLDWLEAIRSRDPIQIRDAQLKIIERRGRSSSTCDSGTGRNQTPGSSFFKTPTPFDADKTPAVWNDGENCSAERDPESIDSSLALDEFFRRYTSEDNASFSKILDKVNRKRKERYGFLIAGENDEVEAIEDVKRDRITDGFGTSDQPPSTLEGWKYTAKNLLMYHPSDRGEAPLTEEERAVRVKGLTKEVSRTNTRFHGSLQDSKPKDEDTIAVLYTPVPGATPVPFSDRDEDKSKKYDLEELRRTPNSNRFYVESGKKSDNGYSFLKTPSPAPGVDESPFVTWGEIEGTPLRLEPEETPPGIGGSGRGPHFSMPRPPSRDVKAHSLSREAARKLRERSRLFQKPPLPSPVRGGSASPGGRPLSTAAQKLVRNAMAKSSSSVDETLRASYRGRSPSSCTPKAARSMSRFGRDANATATGSRSPSLSEASGTPW